MTCEEFASAFMKEERTKRFIAAAELQQNTEDLFKAFVELIWQEGFVEGTKHAGQIIMGDINASKS